MNASNRVMDIKDIGNAEISIENRMPDDLVIDNSMSSIQGAVNI